jgi:hypothetical protein
MLDSRAFTKEAESMVFNYIGTCVDQIFKIYKIRNEAYGSSTSDTGYELVKYDIGHQCHAHIDSPVSGNNRVRIATVLLHLNDCDSKTTFRKQNRIVDTEQGQAIIFPPAHTHHHAVSAPTDTPRYVIVCWITIKNLYK